jgi:hypothetical protein
LTGAFTTLTSSGNSTLGTGILAVTNSFGTAGNLAAATNTIGSNFAGSMTTTNGRSTFSGTNQTGDLITVNNIPQNASGITVNAGSTAGNNITGETINATGGGSNNTGLSITESGASVTNIGQSISVNGNGRIGQMVNANGAGTGVVVNNAFIGYDVPGVGGTLPANATGYQATLSAGTTTQTGVNVNMNNASAGANGINVTNVGTATAANISMTGGTGTGLNITNVGSGVGASVTGTGSGTLVKASQTAGSGTAVLAQGDATASTTALEVNNGRVRSTGGVGTQFAGREAWVSGGTGQQTINNTFLTPGASVIVTYENTSGSTTTYVTSVAQVGSGTMLVNCSAPTGGFIDYIIINH